MLKYSTNNPLPNSDTPAVIELIHPDEFRFVAQPQVVVKAVSIKEIVKEIAVEKIPSVSRKIIIRGDPERSTSEV